MTGHPGPAAIRSWQRAGTSWHSRRLAWPVLPRSRRRLPLRRGRLTVGVHITLAPTWLDPAETAGIITPFMVLYALHDAVAKPMPQGNPAPSLAESWSGGEDGLSYEFVLRKDAKFHNGDPVTADDVKFSFERYRGAAHASAEGAGCVGGDARSAARRLQAENPLAGLHHLLCRCLRRRLGRAAQVCGEGRGRRIQKGPDRRRAIQVRLVHARRGAGAGGLRAGTGASRRA